MILLAITTDGRGELLEQTVASFEERVSGVDGPRLIFDDSGDPAYQAWLHRTFGHRGYAVIGRDHRVGQDKALVAVWEHLARDEFAEHPWVWFLEDDFTFERDVDLDAMRAVLDTRPYLLQMALLRQPWFPGEVRAGGIVERDPEQYTRHIQGEAEWLEHRLWFTLNPNLFRRELCSIGRPVGRRHEWNYSRKLCRGKSVQFGIWGDGCGDTPWCRHEGRQRVGTGY